MTTLIGFSSYLRKHMNLRRKNEGENIEGVEGEFYKNIFVFEILK